MASSCRGIFANVDFDALNRKKAPQPKEEEENKKKDEPPESGNPPTEEGSKQQPRPRASDFLKDSSDDEKGEASFGPAKPPAKAHQSSALQKVLGEV